MAFKDILFFPVKIFSTIFGIGYFPVWNRVWASFFAILALLFSTYIVREFYGFVFIDPQFISLLSLKLGLFMMILGLISGRLFLSYYKEGASIVSDATMSQFFVISLSMPAIINIGDGSLGYLKLFCDKFLYCPNWFYSTVSFLLLAAAPFASCRFFDEMEFWPSSYLNVRYHDSIIAKHIASLSCCFYAIVLLYLVAFLVFKLSVSATIHFYEKMFSDFYIFAEYFVKLFLSYVERANFMKFFID